MPSVHGKMPSTRKVVAISDVHLGQRGEVDQYSLLAQVATTLLQGDSETMRTRFAQTIRDFARGDKVTLVATGDIFDLSLSYLRDALEDFVALLKPIAEVEELVLVIGNHDAHIWSMHENYMRAIEPMLAGKPPEMGSLYDITERPVEVSKPLGAYIAAQCPQVKEVYIAYPTYEYVVTQGALAGHLVHFTHGHLFGGLYTELSKLFEQELAEHPESTDGRTHERLAATVNLSVIEFIYWLLGETGGGLGADGVLETVYHDLKNGDHSRIAQMIRDVAEPQLSGLLSKNSHVRRTVLDAIVWIALKVLEKEISKPTRSNDRGRDHEATRERLRAWLGSMASWSPERPATVVYGHTHRADEWSIPDTQTTSYNLGSWLVERKLDGAFHMPEPRMLLIDDDGIVLKDLAL